MGRIVSLYPGRFQPFHKGHTAIVKRLQDDGHEVIVGIRDTPLNANNPYPLHVRADSIRAACPELRIVALPDFDEIVYGRGVGYGIREVRLPVELEAISATRLRRHRVVWLTGNSGSGKSTLAQTLSRRLPSIVLDGDEMRASISTDMGMTLKDRMEHNIRVARLAAKLSKQTNVIVAVIAPTSKIRRAITTICHPWWVYLPSRLPPRPDYPYEVPDPGDVYQIDHGVTPTEAADLVLETMGRG